jgi:hypothetical protein
MQILQVQRPLEAYMETDDAYAARLWNIQCAIRQSNSIDNVLLLYESLVYLPDVDAFAVAIESLADPVAKSLRSSIHLRALDWLENPETSGAIVRWLATSASRSDMQLFHHLQSLRVNISTMNCQRLIASSDMWTRLYVIKERLVSEAKVLERIQEVANDELRDMDAELRDMDAQLRGD